jgi:hypothetical protein
MIQVGGLVDEARVTLGIHGADLDPEEVSAILQCRPSQAHRKGDVRPCRAVPWSAGAWLLSVDGRAPTDPESLLVSLFARLPDDPGVWKQLRQRFTLRLGLGLFLDDWNRGFELSPGMLRRIAATGVAFSFDMYVSGHENEP